MSSVVISWLGVHIAKETILTDVLDGTFDLQQVEDQIVLIDVTDSEIKDNHFTPYRESVRGLIINAQMVSQLVSAAKGERSLLQTFPWWGNAVWIWGWSLVGGILAWRLQSQNVTNGSALFSFGLAGAIAIVLLAGSCFGFLVIGTYWVPFGAYWVPFIITR